MEFKEYRLFELSKDNKGYYGIGASAVEYDKNLYTYLRITDIKDDGSLNYSNLKSVNDENVNKFILENGDIVFARTGNSTGKSYYYDGEILNLVYAGFLIKFSLNDKKVNPKFIKYYTMTNEYKNWVKEIQTGSTRGNINEKMYGNMRIKLPPRYYQDEVVSLLDKIDKKIKINNQINDNLHELEKNLYKEYFSRLDDNTKKLGELCKIKYGKGLPITKIENEGYSVYGGNGTIGYYHEYMYEESQILISCRGAASGNVIVSKPKSFITNNSLILECDRKYHHYLKQYSLDNYYYEYTTGSAQPQITIDNIKDITLNIPPKELLDKFNKQMESLENNFFTNLEEINKLEQLRDTLLPKLMNGEINLDKIEI